MLLKLKMQNPKISLCIATYKRFDFLSKYLPDYLKNPYIDEIVITDEDGHDSELIETYFDNPKIKIYQNDKHLGAFLNKERAVSLATNDWIALIDSDNYCPIEYFEAWIKYVNQNEVDAKCIYCPSYLLESNLDFSFLLGYTVKRENIKSFWNIHNFGCFLNAGNYIVNKQEYLHNPGNRKYENSRNLCIDVLYRNIFMMLNGCCMKAIPNMSYFHIIRPGSFYLQNHETPGFDEMRKDIESMILS
jgi:hypothetical protein